MKSKNVISKEDLLEKVNEHHDWVFSGKSRGIRLELSNVAINLEDMKEVFSGAILRGARFKHCEFLGNFTTIGPVVIDNVDLRYAVFEYCESKHAPIVFKDSLFTAASIFSCKLIRLKFDGHTDLSGLGIETSNLRGLNIGENCDTKGLLISGSVLTKADLRHVNLNHIIISSLELIDAILPPETFSIIGEEYVIEILNGECVRAGCQNHPVEEWYNFPMESVFEMDVNDGDKAVAFYPRLLDIIEFYLPKYRGHKRPDWLDQK